MEAKLISSIRLARVKLNQICVYRQVEPRSDPVVFCRRALFYPSIVPLCSDCIGFPTLFHTFRVHFARI